MYRLRVVPFFIPTLKQRKDDIPLLIWSFIDQLSKNNFRSIEQIETAAFEKFMDYSWPGNVRELRNNIEYALAVGNGTTIKLTDLNPDLIYPNPYTQDLMTSNYPSEKELIHRLLEEFSGRKQKVATKMNISRSTLWRKMKEYNLS